MEHCQNCGGDLKIIAAILEVSPDSNGPEDRLCLAHARASVPWQPGNREDPHASWAAGPGTAARACPWPGPASGLTLPNRDRSGDPATRAAGVG